MDIFWNSMVIDDLYKNRSVRIYKDYSPSIRAERSGLKVLSCAMRGRYDNNGKTQQQLEINFTGISNAITTVEKDSLVLISHK